MSEITKEEKKKYQIVSKILWILARIGNVCCWIGAVAVAVVAIAAMIISPNFNIDSNKKELTLFDKTASYTIRDKDFELKGDDSGSIVIKNNIVTVKNGDDELMSLKVTDETLDEVEKAIEDKLPGIVTVLPFVLTGAVVVIALSALALGHGASVFKNIANKKTPFVKDNITRTEKAFKYMVASAIISIVVDFVASLIAGINNHVFAVTSIAGILATYVMIYIFKAGYQLEDKNKEEE